MPKVTFTVKSNATTQTLFVLPDGAPHDGDYVALKKKDGAMSGTADLASEKHSYLIRLESGAPESAWTLTIQQKGSESIERKGKLNAKGNGGRIGKLTVL